MAKWQIVVGAGLALLMLPAAGRAQSTGTIAGAVKDTTGAVMPGVTVEAASPALIEKVRSVVTDRSGAYKIVDLRPGAYTVTFTLTGFSTVKREQLALNSGVTLQVDADLKVGNLEETITVSGGSPVVDTQNVRTQNVLTRDTLDVLPSAKNPQAIAQLTLGAIAASRPGARDVGGVNGEDVSPATIQGGSNSMKMIDGVYIGSTNFPAYVRHPFNQLDVEEIVVEATGLSAEGQNQLNINVVSKSGGNSLSGVFNGDYAGPKLQSDNLSSDLQARGLTSANSLNKIYDAGFSFGGPLKKDRLWFFTAHRWQDGSQYLAGLYQNKTANTLFYTPDLSQPTATTDYSWDSSGRITWQATSKQKLMISGSWGTWCHCMYDSGGGGFGVLTAPEGRVELHVDPSSLLLVNWTYPVTSRLLLTASFNNVGEHQRDAPTPGTPTTARAITDLTAGRRYGSFMADNAGWSDTYGDMGEQGNRGLQATVSYVTGSHAFKVGIRDGWGSARLGNPGGVGSNFPEYYYFSNGVPVSLGEKAQPHYSEANMRAELGIYGQDQWTVKRMTLNAGLRFDYLNTYVPAGTRPGGIYSPSFSFPQRDCAPCWKDLSPRLGVAYDLFGNGRTAIKASLGKYLVTSRVEISNGVNPALAISAFVTRTWNDANLNLVPDCNLSSTTANGECGPMSDSRFGQPIATTNFAQDVTDGWSLRPYYWQGSVSLQHELRPGIGLTAAYFRTSYGNNFSLNAPPADNLAVTPADFTPYCVTAPSDSRLPGGGGYPICGVYNVNPNKFGQVNNVVSQSVYSGWTQVYNGGQVAINARFGHGWMVSGGVNTGQTIFDTCSHPDVPVQNCHQSLPFQGQTQIKFFGAFPLPWGMLGSATYLSLPGFPDNATLTYTNAQIAPSLGRNLAACGAAVTCTATVTLQVVPPNTLFEPRQNQVDVRLSKVFNTGRIRVEPRLDAYNVFNSAAVLNLNSTYGRTWLQPTDILTARFFKFGVRVSF